MDNRNDRTRELSLFFSKGLAKSYQRGETIVSPYDASGSTYFIENGFVKSYGVAKGGYQNLLCILSEGDILPLPGAFGIYKNESYYVAMSSVYVRRLPAPLLRREVEQNSTLSQAVMWQFYDVLVALNNRINTLNLRTQSERLASFLVLMSHRYGIPHRGEIILDIPLTHAEIGEAISSTRESVSRTLGAFHNNGIVEQRNHLIVISDYEKLIGML